MASDTAWAGWVFFAGLLMIVIGLLDFFQGLIALIRKSYYNLPSDSVVVVNMTTWGWVLLLGGILIALAGWGLLQGRGWARWFTIVLVVLNILAQLGFAGSHDFTLWGLLVLTLNILVLYALTARWAGVKETYTSSLG
jgi:hypothetical protein